MTTTTATDRTRDAEPQTKDTAPSDQGPGTRRRLLDAAAQLFAAHGYRGVAVRDICDQACANIAAVNYHFGGKDKLHRAAMEHARRRALQEDPTPAGPKPTGPLPPAERLRRHLRAMFGRAFAQGPAGWHTKMVLREMVDPTPALRSAVDENIAPYQRKLEAIVGQLMQQDPDTDAVKDAAAAVLAAAVYYQTCRPAIEQLRPGLSYDPQTADRLTDQLTSMVLHGVAAPTGM